MHSRTTVVHPTVLWLLLTSLFLLMKGVMGKESDIFAKDSIFKMCDEDNDRHLTLEELQSCMGHVRGSKAQGHRLNPLGRNIDPQTVLTLMDTDKNGAISLAEYFKVVETAAKSKKAAGSGGDTVELTDRNGVKRTITTDEMFEKAESSPKDIQMDGDMLVKESEGSADLDSIGRDNPQLNNVITMAKWTLAVLIDNHVVPVNSTLLRLNTLPSGGHGVEKSGSSTATAAGAAAPDGVVFKPGSAEAWLELTISSTTTTSATDRNNRNKGIKSEGAGEGKGSKGASPPRGVSKTITEAYEVHIRRDPNLYTKPYFNIEQAWRLVPVTSSSSGSSSSKKKKDKGVGSKQAASTKGRGQEHGSKSSASERRQEQLVGLISGRRRFVSPAYEALLSRVQHWCGKRWRAVVELFGRYMGLGWRERAPTPVSADSIRSTGSSATAATKTTIGKEQSNTGTVEL